MLRQAEWVDPHGFDDDRLRESHSDECVEANQGGLALVYIDALYTTFIFGLQEGPTLAKMPGFKLFVGLFEDLKDRAGNGLVRRGRRKPWKGFGMKSWI